MKPQATSPCGTRAAEARHRQAGAWPCYVCLDVRADVAQQLAAGNAGRALALDLMCREIRCPSDFTPSDRLELARAAHDMAPPVDKFARVLGLPLPVAQRLYVALSDMDRERKSA